MSKIKLPQYLFSRYRFIKKFENSGLGQEAKAVYLDTKNNNKVVIKIGTNKKLLENEFIAQKFFYKGSIKLSNSKVIIPKPVSLIKSDKYFAIVMEYLKMNDIINLEIQKKVNIYLDIFRFLRIINAGLVKNTRPKLKIRSAVFFAITIPYYLTNLLNKVNLPDLIRSLFIVFNQLPKWLYLDFKTVSHGDINTTNIYLSKNKIVLIDFGESIISHRFFDISKGVNSCWYQPGFSELLLKNLRSGKLIDNNDFKIFKSFAIYNLYLRLSDKSSGKQKSVYLTRLKKLIEYKYV